MSTTQASLPRRTWSQYSIPIIHRIAVAFVLGTALGAVVGFVAGVDPILGRIATTNNVTGDLAVASVVGKWTDGIDLTEGVWADGSQARGDGEDGVPAGD